MHTEEIQRYEIIPLFKFEIKVTLVTTMAEMSKAEIVKFLMQGTLTGEIATVKKDGSSMLLQFGLC
jgi:hypothetical protein